MLLLAEEPEEIPELLKETQRRVKEFYATKYPEEFDAVIETQEENENSVVFRHYASINQPGVMFPYGKMIPIKMDGTGHLLFIPHKLEKEITSYVHVSIYKQVKTGVKYACVKPDTDYSIHNYSQMEDTMRKTYLQCTNDASCKVTHSWWFDGDPRYSPKSRSGDFSEFPQFKDVHFYAVYGSEAQLQQKCSAEQFELVERLHLPYTIHPNDWPSVVTNNRGVLHGKKILMISHSSSFQNRTYVMKFILPFIRYKRFIGLAETNALLPEMIL